jgi:hypothetical protein
MSAKAFTQARNDFTFVYADFEIRPRCITQKVDFQVSLSGGDRQRCSDVAAAAPKWSWLECSDAGEKAQSYGQQSERTASQRSSDFRDAVKHCEASCCLGVCCEWYTCVSALLTSSRRRRYAGMCEESNERRGASMRISPYKYTFPLPLERIPLCPPLRRTTPAACLPFVLTVCPVDRPPGMPPTLSHAWRVLQCSVIR